MKSRIYFNLNKKLWSVQQKVNGKLKVVGHFKYIIAKPLKFHVGEGGRDL